jgi:hypothetical protein
MRSTAGDVAHAQLVALHIRMPEPSALGKRIDDSDLLKLVRGLRQAGLLSKDFDPEKHPRWPAGSPNSVGGQFSPAGGEGGSVSRPASARLIAGQIAVPVPVGPLIEQLIPEMPDISIPSELVPPPISGPSAGNPYPNRPECVKEWADAEAFCRDLQERKVLEKKRLQIAGQDTRRMHARAGVSRLRRKHEVSVMRAMKEPETAEEVLAEHRLRRADPQRYLRLVNARIRANPANSHAYFGRHLLWMDRGEPQKAVADITRCVELDPSPVALLSRGQVRRHLGEYGKALDDFAAGEAMDPQNWQDDEIPLLYQADTYARAGDEEKALACCARLPDNFWTPVMNDTPPGGKAEIAAELSRRAAAAREHLTGGKS